jgi:hypothetical protein
VPKTEQNCARQHRETEKKAFSPGLTIASVKEKEINPMTMDARLIEARAMAFGGTSAHRSQTWGSGGGQFCGGK